MSLLPVRALPFQTASSLALLGGAEAFAYANAQSGPVTQLSLYVDSTDAASTLLVGLFSDNNDHPGNLLTGGAIANPTKGAWNTATVPSYTLTAGATYWIALLSPYGGGTAAFRDAFCCGGDETSQQTTLTALPTTWTTGQQDTNGPASAYVGQPLPLGDRTVEGTVDGNTPGQAEAFVYTAQATGTVNQAAVYLDTSNAATTVRVGVYADNGSNAPGSLLAQGTITNPTNAAWNMANLASVNLTGGTKYWIALLGPAGGGTVHYRDTSSGSQDYVSQQTNLTSLPSSWASGQGFINAPMSAYLVEAGTTQTYSYDPVGNRASLSQGSATSYTYDKADRILTAGSTGYSVDNAGNLIARGSDSFAYDQANRLKSATVAGTTTAYVYDGDGKRASQATGGTTTSYVYDANGSLPDVLTDGSRKYVYGLGLAYAVDTAGNVQVYHADGLGSVRALTDATGNLIQTYQTDPFGVATQTQGTRSQPFG